MTVEINYKKVGNIEHRKNSKYCHLIDRQWKYFPISMRKSTERIIIYHELFNGIPPMVSFYKIKCKFNAEPRA